MVSNPIIVRGLYIDPIRRISVIERWDEFTIFIPKKNKEHTHTHRAQDFLFNSKHVSRTTEVSPSMLASGFPNSQAARTKLDQELHQEQVGQGWMEV